LADELPRVGRITFRDLTAAFVEKLEIVVRFLAVLELFKQGHIDVDQATNFGDIEIIWIGGDAGADAHLALVDTYEG
jgi:segregation and condensation protein A